MSVLTSLRNAAAVLSLALLAVLVAGSASTFYSCKKKVTDPDTTITQVTPRDNILAFIKRHCEECDRQLITLELVIEPLTGSQDTNAARAAWRMGRAQYELVRFGPQWYLPLQHNYVALWFTGNPQSGFHFLEKSIFIPSPNMKQLEPQVENVALTIRSTIPNGLANAGVTDDGIFHGLLHMLYDIDSIKLSGADKLYSNNSFNDAINNLNGLDSAYSYYKGLVKKSSPGADSMFVAELAATRLTLQNAGSMDALDKNAFRTQVLPALVSALRQVAAAINVTL